MCLLCCYLLTDVSLVFTCSLMGLLCCYLLTDVSLVFICALMCLLCCHLLTDVSLVFLCSLQLPANMSGSEKREKMVVWEAAISSSLTHPNIVQTYTYSIKPLKESVRNESLRESGYGSAVVIVK